VVPTKFIIDDSMELPTDGVVGLGGLTIQAHCLSRHNPQPPQPLTYFPPDGML